MGRRLTMMMMVALVAVLAQRPDNHKTFGSYNGRAWLAMVDRLEKVSFMAGYDNGVWAAESNVYEPAARKRVHQLLPDSTVGDTVDFLDVFFKTPENRALPISDGLQIFGMKLRGESDDAVTKRLQLMRSTAAEPTN